MFYQKEKNPRIHWLCIGTCQVLQTPRSVKSENLSQKSCIAPLLFHIFWRWQLFQTFKPVRQQFKSSYRFILILYYVGRSKHAIYSTKRLFNGRVFHKMWSCSCIQNHYFFTKSVYFAFLISCFLFIFYNLKLSSKSNINLISRFPNADIFWADPISTWSACFPMLTSFGLIFYSFLPESDLARVSFKAYFSSNHCNDPFKVK